MPWFSKPVNPHNWKCFGNLFLSFVVLAKLGGININTQFCPKLQILSHWFVNSLWTVKNKESIDSLSIQFSHSVVSDSLWPHESQHARPLCPSPTPGVYTNLCPSSRWCHPAISSSVIPSSSCPQSLPASKTFPMSQLFAWGGQSIGVSALASVLPMNTQADLLQNGLVGSPCSPRDSQESSPTPQFKSINSSVLSFLRYP